MKIVLAGIAAALILGAIVGLLLPSVGEPAYQAYSSSSVRVGMPGSNLVGPEWREETAGQNLAKPGNTQ